MGISSIFSQGDVAAFRSDRLAPVQALYFSTATFSDAYLLQQMQAAEQDIAKALKVYLQPTHIFPFVPTQDQINALPSGLDWEDEPGYDYDYQFFQGERWGYIVVRHIPIISVTSIKLAYPNPTSTVWQIPNDWLRLDRKYGHIRLVPASSTYVAPLGAFLMQALGGGSSIPSMIQVEYDAGLNAKSEWPAVIDVIMKKALLKIMQGAYVPGSKTSSADGLSQSLSFKIQDYEDQIQTTLFGPKGSNGGLWTAIHGIQSGFLGMVA